VLGGAGTLAKQVSARTDDELRASHSLELGVVPLELFSDI
jgi:hypothetical protein